MKLDPALLEIIRCPVCHAHLTVAESAEHGTELVCEGCPNAYPVRDEIPVLLADEARQR